MQLFSRRWGQPSKSKLLMLHGMGGTGTLWRPLAAALEDRFEILAPDQRGHGSSRVPSTPGGRVQPGYTPLDYGRDLVETLRAESFHPTWVLGHSMGVRSACSLAHLQPDWVKGLILIDLGFSGVAGGGLGEGLASFVRKLPESFASREEARAFMKAECPDPSIAQYLMAVSVRGPAGELTFPFDRAALIATITAARDASVRTWVKEVAGRGMPVLVLRGGSSLVWPHEEFEREREALKGFTSVSFEEIAGAGHGLPFEKRVEVATKISDWIAARG